MIIISKISFNSLILYSFILDFASQIKWHIGKISKPIALISKAFATNNVVPEPAKGSSKVSPGLKENFLVRFLTNSSENPSLYLNHPWTLFPLLPW